MASLIEISHLSSTKTLLAKDGTQIICPANENLSNVNDAENLKTTIQILVHNHPDKILFTANETAKILGVGEEFIRRRIKSGSIRTINLGDKPKIHLTEIARLTIEGVT